VDDARRREEHRILIGAYVTEITHRLAGGAGEAGGDRRPPVRGRLTFGVGAAWNEREHEAFGMPFPPPRARVDLVGEALETIPRLERDQPASFAGEHISLVDVPFLPKPVNGHIPILIGSRGRRMLRHVARYADYWDLAAPSEEDSGGSPPSSETNAGRSAGIPPTSS
jgi:alkanesulfonate monooxygenase SsuD/methylene tetrahydromethanopterin reductase-like flavin-dependent oxidoreductase (luciferase family)